MKRYFKVHVLAGNTNSRCVSMKVHDVSVMNNTISICLLWANYRDLFQNELVI